VTLTAGSPTTARRATILAQDAVPAAPSFDVKIHYLESGEYRQLTVGMRRSTYYDHVVVSSLHELLPPGPPADIEVDSARSLARYAYHAARHVGDVLRPTHRYARPIFDTRSFEPNNFAHILLEVLPCCLRARAAAGPSIDFLFRRVKGRCLELLNVFDIAPVFERRRVEAEVIKVRGARGLAVFDFLGNPDCVALTLFPDIYADYDFRSALSFKKIFLARRGPRSLINQVEVDKVVTKHGYKVIFMEDYSVLEQLSIAAQATHVVAVHGAAMSLLVANRRIDSVIELLPPHNYGEIFPITLGTRVMRYEQIVPDYDPTVVHSGWPVIASFKDVPFSVDVNLLDGLLQQSQ